jgi:flagellar motor switch protein FliM
VLRGLLRERAQAKKALRVRPLASRLQVTLEGRLVSKQVQLGACSTCGWRCDSRSA